MSKYDAMDSLFQPPINLEVLEKDAMEIWHSLPKYRDAMKALYIRYCKTDEEKKAFLVGLLIGKHIDEIEDA